MWLVVCYEVERKSKIYQAAAIEEGKSGIISYSFYSPGPGGSKQG